jgi:hypothetical protein
MSSRPKRKARNAANYDGNDPDVGPSQKRSGEITAASDKRRATGEGKPGSLEWILSSAKSPLCTIDMSVSTTLLSVNN